MKTLLMSAAVLAALLAPVAADAAPCRNAKGQFAKCGAPGAMTDAQYKAMKGKPMMMMAKPATPAPKPMMMMAKPAPAPAKPVAMMAKPAAPAKKGPCKDGKGKFIKCK